MSEIEKQAKNTELLNLFKPPKPLNVGFKDFIRDLIIMTVVVIIFFWFGASFHTLMYGYRDYMSKHFKGVNIYEEPYKDGFMYSARGKERFWSVFPEIIDWSQGTLKDVFSSGNYLLMRAIMFLRDGYREEEIPEKKSGFFGLMMSSLIAIIALIFSPVIAIILILVFGSFNIKHFFFTKNIDVNPEYFKNESLFMSIWTGNGSSWYSLALLAKLLKLMFLPNNIFLIIGWCLMFAILPAYIWLAMLYWLTVFVSKGSKEFNKEGKFNQILKILRKHSLSIASFWLILGGLVAWRNLGFGATIAALVVLILHLGANFFGYSSKEKINVNLE